MPKYQFLYSVADGCCTVSDPECSEEEILEAAIENAEDMVRADHNMREIIIAELDENLRVIDLAAKVKIVPNVETTYY